MAILLSLTTAMLLLASPAGGERVAPEEVEALLASPSGQRASRLVSLLRSDEVARGVARHLTQTLRARGRIDGKQLACLDELAIEDFNQIFTAVLLADYDAAVIDRAFEFYSSPIGARYMRLVHEKSWRTTPEDFPLQPDRPREGLTMQQWQVVVEFKQSALGEPFADPRVLTQSRAGLKASATLWAVKALQCGVPEEVIHGAKS